MKIFTNLFYSKSNSCCLIGIILVSLIIRALVLYLDPLLFRDATTYIKMAEAWHNNGSYQGMLNTTGNNLRWVPPFSIFLTHLVMYLGVSAEVAARTLTIIFGASIPLIGYGIAKVVCRNRYVALCAALFLAINPELIKYSIQPIRESFYFALIGMVLYYICRGIRFHAGQDWALAGLFCAISCLTRYESLEFLIYVVIYFIVSTTILKQYMPMAALKSYFLFVITFLVTFSMINVLMGTHLHILDNYYYYFSRW